MVHIKQSIKIQDKQDYSQFKFIFNIDRGGTFTDFYVQQIFIINSTKQNNMQTQTTTQSQQLYKIINQFVFKFPSQSDLGQGPIVGIRNFLIQKRLMNKQDIYIPLKNIFQINLGTTIATNALLQRKGEKNCMILTKGFKDLLTMRHLARPNIFDLKCQRAIPLFTQIIQADQRIFVKEPPPYFILQKVGNIQNGIQIYRKSIQQKQIERICRQIKQKQYKTVGISFCHSLMDKRNQQLLKQALLKQNINYIQTGSSFSEVGYLKRSQTTNLNAFLGPLIKKYFIDFVNNFQKSNNKQHEKQKSVIRVMKSNGGFSSCDNIKPSQILLSGPAGGLIGYNKMIQTMQSISQLSINNMIGLDMGGTSTDISRVQNRQFNLKQTIQLQSIFICQPHLQIQTIAAGGGSKLYYENGLFKVGPQSVGSFPGPACYGIEDQLALTDANFLLNRIDGTYFPKIFGKNRNQGLNIDFTKKAFQKICAEINIDQQKHGLIKKQPQQIAQGFIRIANQLMAKSARKFFTFGIPDAFVVFGSAGGQHCCDLAENLDINNLFIHRYSGVLSAYGLSKAAQTQQKKIFLGKKVTKQVFSYYQFIQSYKKLIEQEPQLKNYNQKKIYVMIGYVGTNYDLLIELSENIFDQFQKVHKKQNGFLLPGKQYRIQYLVIKFFKHPPLFNRNTKQFQRQNIKNYLIKQENVYIQGKWRKIPFYDISNMIKSQTNGPAMIISKTVTVLVKENWNAKIENDCIYLKRSQKKQQIISKNEQFPMDPIVLTLYSTRLMSIAQQMGKVLERISISTNIKQRLDFSCGIFDWNGNMLANAPHIPVHLGSMSTAVKEQIKRGIKSGQSILTNHPIAGGSHLPDLTVVTCFQIRQNLNMFVASRGHHADIGGIAPGSMPPFSKYIQEQGIAVEKFHLTNEEGDFRQPQVRELFKSSRKTNDNISDLLAQVAANKLGIKLLKKFIKQQGYDKFKTYIGYVCKNASNCVQQLLIDFSHRNNFKQIDSIQNSQFMDDGSQIKLKLTINRIIKRAIFDFTGTSSEILGNTNAPVSITQSAILYCLRSLIGKDIPLNAGSLEPVQIIVPFGTLLSPSKNSAVVGGNVQTSQRIVDLILKPFNIVAASQGTMNNFLFGNDDISYYETIGGGSGAGQGFNGKTCQVHMTNTRITDIQHLQIKYPVILKEFSIRRNSGGKGLYKGGNGVIREFLFLEPLKVSLLSERRVFSPYGLKGGQPGKKGQNQFKRYEEQYAVNRSLGSKNMVNVQKYDIIRIETPGGGGYGKQQSK